MRAIPRPNVLVADPTNPSVPNANAQGAEVRTYAAAAGQYDGAGTWAVTGS